MRKRRRSRRRSSRRKEEARESGVMQSDDKQPEEVSRLLDGVGPAISLEPSSEVGASDEPMKADLKNEDELKNQIMAPETVNQVAPLSTKQHHRDEMAKTHGGSIRLTGTTDPGDFHFSAQTENLRTERAEGCGGDDCVRIRGTLIASYWVSPTVTLPSVSDYPDLTPCQQRRVQDAIDNVLMPHEQAHVRAFQTYNGTTRRQFDVTIPRSAWTSAYLDQMIAPEQAARQQAAQNASDALDPFYFDVDLDCEDNEEQK